MRVTVAISDAGFTSRCRLQDAFVLPLLDSKAGIGTSPGPACERNSTAKPLTEQAAGTPALSLSAHTDDVDLPHAVLASPWLLTAASDTAPPFVFESIVLAWRCASCGNVEIEKSPLMSLADTAACAPLATDASFTSRRLRKTMQRRQARRGNPVCIHCYLCPRCTAVSVGSEEACIASAAGATLCALQVRGTLEESFYVECPHCMWQCHRKFDDKEGLSQYLNELSTVHGTVLQDLERAQMEANRHLRALDFMTDAAATLRQHRSGEGNLAPISSPGATDTVSQQAWQRWIDLQRTMSTAMKDRDTEPEKLHLAVVLEQLRDEIHRHSKVAGIHTDLSASSAKLQAEILESVRSRVATGTSSELSTQVASEKELYRLSQSSQHGLARDHVTGGYRKESLLPVVARQLSPATDGAPVTLTSITHSSSMEVSQHTALSCEESSSSTIVHSMPTVADCSECADNATVASPIYSYYLSHPRKEPVLAWSVKPSYASCAATVLLDASECDPSVEAVMRYWSERRAAATATHSTTTTSSIPKFVSLPLSAIIRLPVMQHVKSLVSHSLEESTGASATVTHVFRLINVGTREIILTKLKVARQANVSCTIQYSTPISAESCAGRIGNNHSDCLQGESWVRLAPRCSTQEVVAAKKETPASVMLPSVVTHRCKITLEELIVNLTWVRTHHEEAPTAAPAYVGLLLDCITYLPLKSWEVVGETMEAPSGSFHRISCGLHIVEED